MAGLRFHCLRQVVGRYGNKNFRVEEGGKGGRAVPFEWDDEEDEEFYCEKCGITWTGSEVESVVYDDGTEVIICPKCGEILGNPRKQNIARKGGNK